MLMKVKKLRAKKPKPTLKLEVTPRLQTLAQQITQALLTGRCRLGDGEKIATHSQSGLCHNCLSNLSVKRRQETNEPAKRTRYRVRLQLAQRREDELATHPQPYTRGAAR